MDCTSMNNCRLVTGGENVSDKKDLCDVIESSLSLWLPKSVSVRSLRSASATADSASLDAINNLAVLYFKKNSTLKLLTTHKSTKYISRELVCFLYLPIGTGWNDNLRRLCDGTRAKSRIHATLRRSISTARSWWSSRIPSTAKSGWGRNHW